MSGQIDPHLTAPPPPSWVNQSQDVAMADDADQVTFDEV